MEITLYDRILVLPLDEYSVIFLNWHVLSDPQCTMEISYFASCLIGHPPWSFRFIPNQPTCVCRRPSSRRRRRRRWSSARRNTCHRGWGSRLGVDHWKFISLDWKVQVTSTFWAATQPHPRAELATIPQMKEEMQGFIWPQIFTYSLVKLPC